MLKLPEVKSCIDVSVVASAQDVKEFHFVIENISIREKIEQKLIKDSIQINQDSHIITAKLPFTYDPLLKLASNKEKASKILYQQQLRKLNKPENFIDKEDII